MSRLSIRVLVTITSLNCITGISTIAWSIAESASAPAYVTKADFDQAFADAAGGRRDFSEKIPERWQTAGRHLLSASTAGTSESIDRTTIVVNRDRKGDRAPLRRTGSAAPAGTVVQTIIVRRPAPQPLVGCEPLAAPYADAVLGRINGRCSA
jgi:hypothetical protein